MNFLCWLRIWMSEELLVSFLALALACRKVVVVVVFDFVSGFDLVWAVASGI